MVAALAGNPHLGISTVRAITNRVLRSFPEGPWSALSLDHARPWLDRADLELPADFWRALWADMAPNDHLYWLLSTHARFARRPEVLRPLADRADLVPGMWLNLLAWAGTANLRGADLAAVLQRGLGALGESSQYLDSVLGSLLPRWALESLSGAERAALLALPNRQIRVALLARLGQATPLEHGPEPRPGAAGTRRR